MSENLSNKAPDTAIEVGELEDTREFTAEEIAELGLLIAIHDLRQAKED